VRWADTSADIRVRVEGAGVAIECASRDGGAMIPAWAGRPGVTVSLRAVSSRVTWVRDEAVLDVETGLSRDLDLAAEAARSGESAGVRRMRIEGQETGRLPAPVVVPRKPARWRAPRG
jgi:hypothetical protein